MQIIKEAGKTCAEAVEGTEIVAGILADVRESGDAAVLALTRKFDGLELESLEVPRGALKSAYDSIEPKTVESLEFAAEQLRGFAARQLDCLRPLECETLPGITLGHVSHLASVPCDASIPVPRRRWRAAALRRKGIPR